MWVIEDSDAELEKGEIFILAKKHKVTKTIFNRLLREAEISELAGSVCGPHELLDLRAMSPAAQGNRGDSESYMKHEQEQNNLLTMRSRNTGTYMGEGEWETGEGGSAHDSCTPAARSALIAQTMSCRTWPDNKGSREGTLNRDKYSLWYLPSESNHVMSTNGKVSHLLTIMLITVRL